MDTTELRRLLSEGTKGPWTADTRDRCTSKHPNQHGAVKRSDGMTITTAQIGGNMNAHNDARLIAAAVNALPHLLAVVEAVGWLVAAEESETCTMEDSTGAFLAMREALRAMEAGR